MRHPHLRWGILSTARVLRRFVPALRTCARSQLVAVASRDADRAAACAERWGIPRALGSYQALIDDPEVDVVYIALPNHLHAPLSLRCAQAGKHVLCEKPLALSVDEVDVLSAAAAQRGVQICEAFVHLHHPQAAALRDTLRRGALGRLSALRASYGFRLTDEANIRWRPEYGGGALWDVGCYPVSLFVYLAGGAPVEVTALQERSASGVDQSLSGVLRFAGEGGALLAHFDCSFLSPLREWLEIAGERGVLQPESPYRADVDGSPNGFTLRLTGEQEPTVVRLPATEPFACEIQALEAAVLDGAAPRVPLSLSRQIAQTLTALYESARGGRSVRL